MASRSIATQIRNGGGTIVIICLFQRGQPTDIRIEVFGPSEDREPALYLPPGALKTLLTALSALADVLDWADIPDESWGRRPDACGWLRERCELEDGCGGDPDQ